MIEDSQLKIAINAIEAAGHAMDIEINTANITNINQNIANNSADISNNHDDIWQ